MDFERTRGRSKSPPSNYVSTTGHKGYIHDLHLDNKTLDLLSKYTCTDSQYIKRGALINIAKFLDGVDPKEYNSDAAKLNMVNFIRKGLDARLNYNLNDPELIIRHINGGFMSDNIVDVNKFSGLDQSRILWINDMISRVLKFDYVFDHTDKIMEICTRFKTNDYSSKAEIVAEFESAIDSAKNDFRRATVEDEDEIMFSLEEQQFNDCVTETHNKLSNPGRKLVTGMQGLNRLLGGGFENTRCYVIFGLQGEGKSTVLLNLAYQIKKYNKCYKTKDPTKIPTVVLLTMENKILESVQRLFGMSCPGVGQITEHNIDEVIHLMRTQGELQLNDESPINIVIKFKATNSVDTSYLYTLCDELEDRGLECICMIQDYIGRIRSTERFPDMRLELGAVTDEFKVFASHRDIPVISASQLNRDASRHIDDARKSNKSDLVRLIGRSNIAESSLILNNVDGAFIITPEYTEEGERYMGIQLIKKRYENDGLEFVYIPFMQGSLRMIEDYGKEAVYRTTLKKDNEMFGVPTNQYGIKQSPYHTNPIMSLEEVNRKDAEAIGRGFLHESSFDASKAVSEKQEAEVTPYQFKPSVVTSYFDKPATIEQTEHDDSTLCEPIRYIDMSKVDELKYDKDGLLHPIVFGVI